MAMNDLNQASRFLSMNQSMNVLGKALNCFKLNSKKISYGFHISFKYFILHDVKSN